MLVDGLGYYDDGEEVVGVGEDAYEGDLPAIFSAARTRRSRCR